MDKGKGHYIIWEDLGSKEQDVLKETLIGKSLYCFNLNFDASQLKHNRFRVEDNTWYDLSVLGRMCANKEMKEGERFGLAEMALRLLKLDTKEGILKELCQKYKVKGRALAKGKLYSVKGMPHDERFKEYALNDLDLTLRLLDFFKGNRNYNLWYNRISPLFFKQWEVSFKGIKINVQVLNQRIRKLGELKDKVLNLLPKLTRGTKSNSKSKGWNVNSIVTPWFLKEFKEEDLEGLPRMPKGNISFNKDTRRALLLKFPNHPIISKLPDLSKKNKTLDQLKEIRNNLDGDLLRYAYKVFGATTGRFTSSKPAVHNFAKRAPREEILTLKEERETPKEIGLRYQLRRLLIKKEGLILCNKIWIL